MTPKRSVTAARSGGAAQTPAVPPPTSSKCAPAEEVTPPTGCSPSRASSGPQETAAAQEIGAIFELTLPWPPTKLSPNARLHHMALAREKKRYRRACWATALQQGAGPIEAERLSVHLTFVPPNRRARDEDNLVASMKSGLDGLSDAIGVDDSRWKLTHEIAYGEIGGMVRVRVEVTQ